MGFFSRIFRKSVPSMRSTVTHVERDVSGNMWYVRVFNGDFCRWKIDYDMSSLLDKRAALSACSPFYTVVDKVGKMMSRGVPYVVDKRGNEKRSFNEVKELLLNPNPLQTFSSFAKEIEMNLIVFGFCPLVLVRGFQGSFPKAMWVVPPELFHIVSTGKLFREFELEEIVQRRYISWAYGDIELEEYECVVIYNGTIRVDGKGTDIRFDTPSDSLSKPISNWIASMSASHTLITNGGPKGIVYNNYTDDMGNSTFSKDEIDEMKREFKKKYGLVNKEFPILVTNKSLGWIPLDFNAAQLKLHEEDERCTVKICTTLGINSNLFTDAKYDNQESAKMAAYQDVIIPDSKLIAASLTKAICPDGAFIRIDFSDVECLQESKDSEASTLVKVADAMQRMLDKGLITHEEARLEVSKYIDIDPDNPKGKFPNSGGMTEAEENEDGDKQEKKEE